MTNNATLPHNYRLISHAILDSTNDEALRLLGHDVANLDKMVICADEQTAARGRRGRSWSAPLGNLYCSIILKPRIETRHFPNWAMLRPWPWQIC